jgi:hypothetical protein
MFHSKEHLIRGSDPSLWSIGLDFNDDNDSQKSVKKYFLFFLLQNKF